MRFQVVPIETFGLRLRYDARRHGRRLPYSFIRAALRRWARNHGYHARLDHAYFVIQPVPPNGGWRPARGRELHVLSGPVMLAVIWLAIPREARGADVVEAEFDRAVREGRREVAVLID